MKKTFTILAAIVLFAGCFAGCGAETTSSGVITSEDNTAVSLPVETTASETESGDKSAVTAPSSRVSVGEPTQPQTAKVKPKAEVPTAISGTTITSTFRITKVNGTYLELNRLDGNDVEKLTYSCDLGNLDGSADMHYKVGDYIVLRYDPEIAETYPLQLTVKEVYPPVWNGTVEEHPPERVDGRILVEHNGKRAFISEDDSIYIRSVISEFEVTACALFYGDKEYVIHLNNTSFGGDVIYYDASDGLIGNASIGYVSDKDIEKFNDTLSSYFV